MHKSESDWNKRFGPLITRLPPLDAPVFTVVLFAQSGNDDLATAASVHAQTLCQWELIVVTPPDSSDALARDLIGRIGADRVVATSLAHLRDALASRQTQYCLFLDQGATIRPGRLAHDYYRLEGENADLVLSVPLVYAAETVKAHVLRPPLLLNSVIDGRSLVASLASWSTNRLPLACYSCRTAPLLDHYASEDLFPGEALIGLLAKGTIYLSDKCLTEVEYNILSAPTPRGDSQRLG